MLRLFPLAFVLTTALASAATASATAASTNAAPAAAVAPATDANPYPDAIATQDIVAKSETVLAQYPAPTPATTPDPIESDVEQKMAANKNELQLFADETTRVLEKNPSIDRLRTLQNLGKYLAGFPAGWQTAITDRLNALADELKQIDAARTVWSDTGKALAAASPPAPPALGQRVVQVQARLTAVRQKTVALQNDLLALQTRVTAEHALIAGSLAQLSVARDRAISQLFERNAPPLWSPEPSPDLADANAMTWSRQTQTLVAYVQAGPGRFIIHAVLLVLLVFLFYWLRGYARKWTEDEPGIRLASNIFEHPIATAGLISLIASPLLYYPIAPRLLSAFLGALALVPSVFLLKRLIEPRLFPILYALVAFFFLEELRSVAVLSAAHARAYFLAETLAGVVFLLWLLLSLHRGAADSSTRRFGTALRVGAFAALLFLGAALVANVLGYVLLGNLLGEAVQRSSTLALVLYAGIRILGAILFIMTRLRPLSTFGMVQLHGPMLILRAERALAVLAEIFWVIYTLELFSLAAPVSGWLWHHLTKYDANHDLVLTVPGKIVVAALLGWSVFQISKFIRFSLETDLYPRLHLGAGVPYAISTSLHYAMLVVAFIGATYVLGIDMTKFTIVVSALGVGVGFGLQNIINNFVSGLILLFERPVKIGDSIQSGDATGVVERIGIRASVLRTTNGAEMIVPNGNLISNSVTNWTLSTLERIIIIPFSVPRGPDIDHLIELFATAAAAHPKILKQPPPQVLVVTLGANLGFELRAWTREIEDWNVVRSDLSLAINAALTRENIPLA
jgi:small-conductance mechanosensitive channel